MNHRLWPPRRAALAVTVLIAAALGAQALDESQAVAEVYARSAVIDLTYSCLPSFVGGLRQLDTRAHAGIRKGSKWAKLPYAVIGSGNAAGTPLADGPPENSVVWITAGKPSPDTVIDDARLSFTARAGGTIGVNRDLCTPVRTKSPLHRGGLVGGAVGKRGTQFDCGVPRRVLVRLQATVDGGTALRERGGPYQVTFRVTTAAARNARLGVATVGGRMLAFADVDDSGRARLFVSRACVLS